MTRHRTPGEASRGAQVLGQVFTPPAVADFMVGWALGSGTREVFDPCFGMGGVLRGGPPPRVLAVRGYGDRSGAPGRLAAGTARRRVGAARRRELPALVGAAPGQHRLQPALPAIPTVSRSTGRARGLRPASRPSPLGLHQRGGGVPAQVAVGTRRWAAARLPDAPGVPEHRIRSRRQAAVARFGRPPGDGQPRLRSGKCFRE